MYQSKEDLIKQFHHANVKDDLDTIEEIQLEVLIDIRDVIAHMNSEINNVAYMLKERK